MKDSIYTANSLNFVNGIGFQLDVFDGGQRFFDLRAARARAISLMTRTFVQQYQVALDVKLQ